MDHSRETHFHLTVTIILNSIKNSYGINHIGNKYIINYKFKYDLCLTYFLVINYPKFSILNLLNC